jgi:hypothetical protein
VTLVTLVTPIKKAFFRCRIRKEPIVCVTSFCHRLFFPVTLVTPIKLYYFCIYFAYYYLRRSHLSQLFPLVVFLCSMFFCMIIAKIIYGSSHLTASAFFARNLPRIPMDFTSIWIVASPITHFSGPKNVWTVIKSPDGCHLFSVFHLCILINILRELFSF